jgi:CDP-2,3-bis-(O-geranylgeranyl)-sn-glycerol synthase
MFFDNLIQVFLIFLPAFIANATPVVAKNIPYIRDFSEPIHSAWFGQNKTVRWLITGILMAMITGLILFWARWFFVKILPLYSEYFNLYSSWTRGIFFGGLLGFWALMGDIIESFIKRRLWRKPWDMFQPWDGIDYIIGALLCILPWYAAGWWASLFLLIIWPLLSLVMNIGAYKIGWKDRWY